jgi:hypothetical protein
MSMRAAAAVIFVIFVMFATFVVGVPVCGAQSAVGLRAGVAAVRRDDVTTVAIPRRSDTIRAGVFSRFSRLRSPTQPWAPVASLLLPGAGQWMLGDDRGLAYAAVEVIGWWKYGKDRHEQLMQEATFKQIARDVARAHFSSAPPDGNWTYYEAMRDFVESGSYSMTDVGPVVPETDTTTYNGHVWAIAQGENPDMASALAQYERQAYKPDFLWSWRNALLQKDIFDRTTNKRNDAHSAALADLRVVVLNHLVSMVDAFTTFRLRVQAEADGRTTVSGSLPIGR